MPNEHLVFLTNEYGQAFTGRNFSQWFRRQCKQAGLKDLSAHGVRKAMCLRLAENGAVRCMKSPRSAAMPASPKWHATRAGLIR
jgi:site-specific recombinase XerD